MKYKLKNIILIIPLFLSSCASKTKYYDYTDEIDVFRVLSSSISSLMEKETILSSYNNVLTGDYPIYNKKENGESEKIELKDIGINKDKILGGEKIVVNYQLTEKHNFSTGYMTTGYIKKIEVIKPDIIEVKYIKTNNGYMLKTNNENEVINPIFTFDNVVLNELNYIIEDFSYLEEIENNTTLYATYRKSEVEIENNINKYEIYTLFSFNPMK